MASKPIMRILLIEDNPGDANLVRMLLGESSVKHDLIIANTFFDGIDALKEKEISLVLLDLSLPDSTGFKTLSSYLERSREIPVIVLTGTNNEIVGNQAIKAGAQDFLVKGQFDGKLLGRSIRYALQRHKTQVRLEDTAKNLAISERRFVEAQEMANFGNFEMDIVNNEMKWTDEIYRIFGHQPGSFTPSFSDFINYVHLEDKEKVEDFFEGASKDGQLHQIENRIVIDGRTVKYIAIQTKVNFEELSGKIVLIGAIQDITQRKVNEQLISEKNISSKNSRIKEEALSDLSFHIRTPLSSVVNLLYLLENTDTSAQQKEYLDGVKTSVDDLSVMINNLLNLSLLASEKIVLEEEEFKLSEFLQSLRKVSMLKANKANFSMNFNVWDDLPNKVISDPKKITQLFYNMVDFAIKNVNSNGEINIQAFAKNISDKEVNLCFMVKNTGSKNLSEARIKELLDTRRLVEFDSDEIEEKKEEVGVAIVAKIVESLKGVTGIENVDEKGYNFKVEIPVKVIRQQEIVLTGKPDAPVKILLVEDHFLNQIATKKVLTTWSDFISVDIAENGLVGVEKFREHGYDIILMDIQMPVMDGIEAAMKIREKSSVPIIALTANSSTKEANRCLEVGMNEYLSKPFKPEALYSRIMSLLVGVRNEY